MTHSRITAAGTTRRRRWAATVVAGLLVATVVLAGCGADAGDEGDEGGGGGTAPGAADAEQAPEAADRLLPGGDEGGEAGALVDARAIVYTGEITVRVADVDQAADRTGALAEQYGGFVGGDRRSVDADRSVATVVLRIPSANFTAAVADLGGLGEEESREITTEDVTSEVVDLDARIATAEASVARTRALLERAESISEVVELEQELSTRQEALARLQARQRTLDDLTTLSTITVQLLGPEATEEEPAAGTGFLAGLGAGWDAFTTVGTILVTVLGAMAPFLVALGVPTAAGWWWARRRRARRPAPAAAAASAPATSAAAASAVPAASPPAGRPAG